MACFVAPAVEAIVVTVATKVMQSKAKKSATFNTEPEKEALTTTGKNPFVRRMNWLNTMLWGGSALLAFEHIWHGEVTPWFPFLTAASNPADASAMLREIATVGVSMAVLVTAVWVGMVLVTSAMEKKALKLQTTASVRG